ncbi:MAG: HAD-IIB family hydrolase [Candidatus Pacebacteria bacterium]|nr:HAD-IIB family hydrolase [Candidatus Paceibacterota bacterium]
MNTRTYTHLFFDMDGTVTRSRSLIAPKMKTLLSSGSWDIVIVSGANAEQMAFQMDGTPCYMLCQNGNHALRNGVDMWKDDLTPQEVAEIEAHIAALPRTWDVPDLNDLVEYRGSQVSYSVYGHHAPVDEKERFDPDQNKRKAMLAAVPLVSETVEVKIAGTCTLDYFRKGKNKGYNVARLIEHEDWKTDECIYFGDAVYPGGNDETVIGVIETVGVENPDDTYDKLLKLHSVV